VAAVEGTSFPFEREEGVGATFDGVGVSDATGVGLLGLVFTFFEGASVKPSSVQANG
jgi:hypothetical protein